MAETAGQAWSPKFLVPKPSESVTKSKRSETMNIVPTKMADNPDHRICLKASISLLLRRYLSLIGTGIRLKAALTQADISQVIHVTSKTTGR